MPLLGGRGTLRAASDGKLRAVPASLLFGLGRLRVIGLGTLRGLLDDIAWFDPRTGAFGVVREGAAVAVRPANGFCLLNPPAWFPPPKPATDLRETVGRIPERAGGAELIILHAEMRPRERDPLTAHQPVH